MRWKGKGGSWAAAAPKGDRDGGHSQTKRQRQRAQSRAVLGPYGQSGCARRSRKAWGALRGKTGRSQPGNGTRGAWAEPSGCRRAAGHGLARPRPPTKPGSCSVSGPAAPSPPSPDLPGDSHAMLDLLLAMAMALCPSPRPQGRAPGSLGYLRWGAPSPPRIITRCPRSLANPHPRAGLLTMGPGGPGGPRSPGEPWGEMAVSDVTAVGRGTGSWPRSISEGHRGTSPGPRGHREGLGWWWGAWRSTAVPEMGSAPTCSPLSPGMPGAPGNPGSPTQSGSGLSPCGERGHVQEPGTTLPVARGRALPSPTKCPPEATSAPQSRRCSRNEGMVPGPAPAGTIPTAPWGPG